MGKHSSGVQPDGSWVPQFPGQRPPFPSTHGTRSRIRIAHRAKKIRPWLIKLMPDPDAADAPLLAIASQQLARLELAWAWLEREGLTREDGSPQPLLQFVSKWERDAVSSLRELGLTPMIRRDLSGRRVVTVEELMDAAVAELEAGSES